MDKDKILALNKMLKRYGRKVTKGEIEEFRDSLGREMQRRAELCKLMIALIEIARKKERAQDG